MGAAKTKFPLASSAAEPAVAQLGAVHFCDCCRTMWNKSAERRQGVDATGDDDEYFLTERQRRSTESTTKESAVSIKGLSVAN